MKLCGASLFPGCTLEREKIKKPLHQPGGGGKNPITGGGGKGSQMPGKVEGRSAANTCGSRKRGRYKEATL